jgi:pimeloyl-ACP methyl ester carboxylesterase
MLEAPMRRTLVVLVLLLTLMPAEHAHAKISPQAPVIFVHGMGSSAAEVGETQFKDLLEGVARRYPSPPICQEGAQPGRTWKGSPCVFRYVEDVAETDGGPNDSQSSVQENADKLAREIKEVYNNGKRRITLVGYSMGGNIIRTYLATHRRDAEDLVGAVVLVDAVASGSWGYAFAREVPRRFDGSMGAKVAELMRQMAASSAAVDFTRPATRDLTPRSAHLRRIAAMEVPKNISYYTFWGDIGITIERRLLAYELPDFDLPSLGDLGLLAGDPDPAKLPELGGQRFSPKVDGKNVSLDVPHEARISLDASVVSALLSECGHRPTTDGDTDCGAIVSRHFSIPNTHTAIPSAMDKVMVEIDELGGRVSLLEATLEAIGRHT